MSPCATFLHCCVSLFSWWSQHGTQGRFNCRTISKLPLLSLQCQSTVLKRSLTMAITNASAGYHVALEHKRCIMHQKASRRRRAVFSWQQFREPSLQSSHQGANITQIGVPAGAPASTALVEQRAAEKPRALKA